jgi:hypothetical protein
VTWSLLENRVSWRPSRLPSVLGHEVSVTMKQQLAPSISMKAIKQCAAAPFKPHHRAALGSWGASIGT